MIEEEDFVEKRPAPAAPAAPQIPDTMHKSRCFHTFIQTVQKFRVLESAALSAAHRAALGKKIVSASVIGARKIGERCE